LKFKLDENLDVRLAAAMQAKGSDGDTVLSEALSGTSDEGLFEVCKATDRLWIVEPARVRVYAPEDEL
jgi:hypothetical protein